MTRDSLEKYEMGLGFMTVGTNQNRNENNQEV